MSQDDFLGRGFAFPLEVDASTGRIREAAGEEDIRQAISIILSTRKGERVMRPDFGCDIYNFMFGTVDFTSLHLMEQAVWEALVRWEPRIREIEVEARVSETGEGLVEIRIQYVVRSTNSMYNMVYPFCMNEGTGGA